ncbi:MAG: M24 family metallopeptidase [Chloroflexi bacterium]|nr:M24 family metallopeptidase [Chloroflexota bacterium]
MNGISAELATKLDIVRGALERDGAVAARLRGVDWFAWATCGGSNVVILTTETGVGEVFITTDAAWVLTDEIEAGRLAAEEAPLGLPVWAAPWNDGLARQAFVDSVVAGGKVVSDRPLLTEMPLPGELVAAKRRLLPAELDRYRLLGRDAAEAMTEVLHRAAPDWTEWQLAGAGAEALWRRGIEPTLTLVGGEERLPHFRHATATRKPLGSRAMLVFCGRRHGLYANLTRFVYFRNPTAEEETLIEHVARVEAVTFAASTPGTTAGAVYDVIVSAYAELGHPGQEQQHHQGGTTGYLSREAFALPGLGLPIDENTALAWNPSLPGAKIEDTVITSRGGIEILTIDPAWPSVEVDGRPRPDVLVRA